MPETIVRHLSFDLGTEKLRGAVYALSAQAHELRRADLGLDDDIERIEGVIAQVHDSIAEREALARGDFD